MQRRAVVIAVGIVAVLVVGVFYWSPWGPDEEPVGEPEPAPAEPAEPREPADARPAPAAPLPPLDESDAMARELLGGLSSHAGVEPFLSSDQLVERFVVVVVNVAEGEDPREHVPFLAPEEEFAVVERDGRLVIDPASYDRYDRLAAAFASVDLPASVRAYQRVEPLLDEAYRALGYPDGRFADALDRAIAHLLETPIPTDAVEVRARTDRYEFADPDLEALTRPQKQLLRTGPDNARRIVATLRELRALMVSEGVLE